MADELRYTAHDSTNGFSKQGWQVLLGNDAVPGNFTEEMAKDLAASMNEARAKRTNADDLNDAARKGFGG